MQVIIYFYGNRFFINFDTQQEHIKRLLCQLNFHFLLTYYFD